MEKLKVHGGHKPNVTVCCHIIASNNKAKARTRRETHSSISLSHKVKRKRNSERSICGDLIKGKNQQTYIIQLMI